MRQDSAVSSPSGNAALHPESFPILPADRPLEALALAINEEHALAEQYATMAIHRAHRAGDLMLTAKQRVAHGQWLPWLKTNCPTIKDRTARAYMQLARNWATLESKTATVADLTINEALKLLAEPRPEPEPELGFEPEPLTAKEQDSLEDHAKNINEAADRIEYGMSEVARLVQEAKFEIFAPFPALFEKWCEQELKLDPELRDMLMDSARRWHPRYWDDRQAVLVIRHTLATCGCSSDEIEDFISDYHGQVAEARQ